MKIKAANRLQNIQEYYFSKKLAEVNEMREEGANILNLGVGNPDLPPPIQSVEALNNWSLKRSAHGYQSYKGLPELREAIEKWNKRIYNTSTSAVDEILPLIGSKEGIMHITQAFVNEGDNILIPDPGYPTYEAVANIVGAKVRPYDLLDDGEINLDQITNLIDDRTKIIWVNFPNMPTGLSGNKQNLQGLVDLAIEKGVLIVNDNPYSTILTKEYFSIFQLKYSKKICLELNSVSKSHNMAGWRLGWVTGAKDYIDAILKVKSNMDSGMFLPLQKAVIAALSLNGSWISSLNQEYKKRRNYVWQILDALECSYNKESSGLFVWAKINNGKTAEEFTDEILYNNHVFITPGSIFGKNGEGYIRVSLCNDTKILKEVLKKIKTNKYVTQERGVAAN